jgi:hypothetical protein
MIEEVGDVRWINEALYGSSVLFPVGGIAWIPVYRLDIREREIRLSYQVLNIDCVDVV